MKKIRAQHASLLPPRHWVYRATLTLFITVALFLMIISKTGNPASARLRGAIDDVITPVLSVASRPLDAISDAAGWVRDMVNIHAENVALKNQNAQLLQWQTAAKEMETENQSLHALLNVVPTAKSSYITARVVSDLGGPYVHSALINGGSDQGIRKYEAVINDRGLVGRVVDVGTSSARVLLLSDINSRVPVMAEKSHEKGILSGNNNSLPSLSYLPADSKIEVGERIVTSGDGGVFPKGLPVGIVTSVEKGTVEVQPFVDSSQIDYISVVDYSL